MQVRAAGETQLFYRESGDGPPILLIHGMGGSADVWGEAFELLARDHRVIAYDRRGFTRSLHAPVADPQLHRKDAAALLRALDAAPASVVGWSSGGIVALDLAIHHPELVAALALEEPPLHLKWRPGFRQVRAVLAVEALRRLKGERAASEAFFRWAFRHTSGDTGYDQLDDDVRETLLANGPANVAELGTGTGEHLTKAAVAGITCRLHKRRAQRSSARTRDPSHRAAAPARGGDSHRGCRPRDAPRTARSVRRRGAPSGRRPLGGRDQRVQGFPRSDGAPAQATIEPVS